MITRTAERRAHAAALARRYFLERSVPLSTLEETFRDTGDPLIEELLDLATHEPPSNDRAHYQRKYWPHVAAILDQLDLGDKGKLPPSGRWSLVKVLVLAGTAVTCAIVAAMRMRHGDVDEAGVHAAIYAILAAIALGYVVRQYVRERRRRSR